MLATWAKYFGSHCILEDVCNKFKLEYMAIKITSYPGSRSQSGSACRIVKATGGVPVSKK